MLPAGARRSCASSPRGPRHRDQVLDDWRMRPGRRPRARHHRALRRRVRHRQDDGRRGARRRARPRPVRGRPRHGRGQVRRRDREEPRPDLRRGRRASTACSSSTRPTRSSASAREVRDAHDRYANVESAYLLQRMETFDGLAILATNLRANIDEAFARRLDCVVDFPMPDEEHRLAALGRCLGPTVPRGDDVDLDFCARGVRALGRQHPHHRARRGLPRRRRRTGRSGWRS